MFTGIGIGMVSQRTATSLQALLFGQNEPGVLFDPTDLTTMYVDRAGTTPVTAAGQSVGLRLDKSKGLALGPELVTNGDFSGGSAGWTAQSGWTISSGAASVNSSVAGSTYLRTSGYTAVVETYYRVTFTVTSYTSGTIYGAAGTAISATGAAAVGTYSYLILASGAGGVGVYASNTNTIATIDNISVRELPGNHQVAVSDAKRGVYGWMPKTGRRNLLTYTEQFDNAAWSARWGGSATVSPNDPTFLAPDDTQTVDKVTATIGGSGAGQAIALTSGVTYTFSCWVNSPAAASDLRIATAATGGGVVAMASIPSSASLVRYSLTYTPSVTQTYYVGVGNSLALQTVYIWGAQLELGSTATAYQRVVSQYDITEAGVPTCYYVQADGVDDAYVTPTITPNTDKVQVFAGVRKLSDAAQGIFCEFSPNTSTNNGSFRMTFPGGSGIASYGWLSKGTLQSSITSNGWASPISNVVTGIGDISNDVATIRVNGVAGNNPTDQGTGNFLAYPAYIYSREGTSLPFNGLDFGHAVRFGPNLDAATIARVEALIARNTPGVTL